MTHAAAGPLGKNRASMTSAFAVVRLMAAPLTAGQVSAQAQVYRCPQPNGSTTLSDRPCLNGDLARATSGRAFVASSGGRRWTKPSGASLRLRSVSEQGLNSGIATAVESSNSASRLAEAPASDPAAAVSAASVDRMTTYTVVLGRAIGCGLDVGTETKRVGASLDVTFAQHPSR